MLTRVNTAAATDAMSWLQVIVLSIVQGLTEFLPVSSSGHLRIVSELFWGQDAGASFTAVIQLGTEAAVLVYFAGMIWQILKGWLYLCAVRDGHSRRVLGWAMDSVQDTHLVERALRMAHTLRGDVPVGLVFHALH